MSILSLHKPSVKKTIAKPPAGAIAYASWVFLFRNFRHALWLGWPYLVITSLQTLYLSYWQMTVFYNLRAQTHPNILELSQPFYFLFLLLPIWIYFQTALCISWIRFLTQGIKKSRRCSPIKEYKLVLSCFFYSLFLPSMVIPFLSPLFLVFAAKCNNDIIKRDEAYRLFKGLKAGYMRCCILIALPFGLISLVFTYASMSFMAPSNFQTFYVGHALLSQVLSFFYFAFLPFLYCGVLSAYYLWLKKNPNWQEQAARSGYPTKLNF